MDQPTLSERIQRMEILLNSILERLDTLTEHEGALYGRHDRSGIIARVEALEKSYQLQIKFNERIMAAALGLIGTVGAYLLLQLLGMIAGP